MGASADYEHGYGSTPWLNRTMSGLVSSFGVMRNRSVGDLISTPDSAAMGGDTLMPDPGRQCPATRSKVFLLCPTVFRGDLLFPEPHRYHRQA